MRVYSCSLFLSWLLFLTPCALCAQALEADTEPRLAKLPAGIFVDRSIIVPEKDIGAIGSKLGGKITRLSNNYLRVHGRAIQVNFITAVDEGNATAIEKSLEKIKRKPFVQRQRQIVVEFVGRDIDEAIALKSSYELGVLPKPREITYQVKAELALIDKANYMSCNPLFLAFLQAERDQANGKNLVENLSSPFVFGRSLALRCSNSQPISKTEWKREPIQQTTQEVTTVYEFEAPSTRYGVPFVPVELTLVVDDDGLMPNKEVPSPHMLEGTPYWPATDPAIVRLAQSITQNAETNEQKTEAILKWLSPGKNIKYSGQTGSRYGTEQVLKQKFGHCWDFSDLCVTLARAAGVPSRQVAGWLYGSSGHVWCECYLEGKGWQQVDPTGGNVLPCGLYHLAYFTSNDGEMPIVYLKAPTITMLETKP
jgi:hypothetical protein